MFEPYLGRWSLAADGEPLTTHSSDLLPVSCNGRPAMLKIARTSEEERGNRLMAAWAGNGAAAVLAQDGPALLLDRATGPCSLAEMAKQGEDEAATHILCDVAERLHRNDPAGAELRPLDKWFTALREAGERESGWLAAAAGVASELLATERDPCVLHGDLHHGNVLDFGVEWRAIDPKGLFGERAFEFANLLRNPDAIVSEAPGRLLRQVQVIAERAGVEEERLLRWGYAFAGLSAAWTIGDGETPSQDSAIARIIAPHLGLP